MEYLDRDSPRSCTRDDFLFSILFVLNIFIYIYLCYDLVLSSKDVS
jgi:hypothetical protein